jgi:hypothetical protein
VPKFKKAFVREDKKKPVVISNEHQKIILNALDEPASNSQSDRRSGGKCSFSLVSSQVCGVEKLLA